MELEYSNSTWTLTLSWIKYYKQKSPDEEDDSANDEDDNFNANNRAVYLSLR